VEIRLATGHLELHMILQLGRQATPGLYIAIGPGQSDTELACSRVGSDDRRENHMLWLARCTCTRGPR
jgi:hypothetical protein